MRILSTAAYIFLIIVGFSSCKTTRMPAYFETLKADTVIAAYINSDFEMKIRKGDNLGISINSLSLEENAKFNTTVLTGGSAITVPGYIVNNEGRIKMYRLGEFSVEGMTRKELSAYIQENLKPYLKEPLVNVTFLNHKVTVMGSVGSPQILKITEEKITLLDALVASGDISDNGKVNQVLIIRDNGSEKQVKKVDLSDHSIFNSPWYYLQADDIVYVSPDFEKTDKEERRRRFQTTLSLAASGLSLIIIVIDRIIR